MSGAIRGLLVRGRRGREQAIVVREPVGRDAQVPGAGIGRHKPRDGGRGALGAGALIEAVGDGPRTEGLAGERVGERGIERAGAGVVEEPEEERRVGGQALPAAGEGVEEGVGVRAGLAQAIPAPQVVRAMLGGGERGQVGSASIRWPRSYVRTWHATALGPFKTRT